MNGIYVSKIKAINICLFQLPTLYFLVTLKDTLPLNYLSYAKSAES